ncbi:MAG: hypothetical protein AAGD09_04040 [Cyanobacteria bacterium P01_F01_bin.56]
MMRKKNTRISTLFAASLCFSSGLVSSPVWASAQLTDTATPTRLLSFENLAQNPPPPVPPQPAPLPSASVPAAAGIVGLTPENVSDIGVGHLRPQDTFFLDSPIAANRSLLGAGWLQSIAIPIYIEPNGAYWGWIVNGWLVPNGQAPIAIGQDASFLMLQTDTDLLSFPVTQIRADGWFQFQYTPAGSAWAHVGHLNLGATDLAIESWENHFINVGRVEFRQHGLSQSLYRAPSGTTESILGLVGPNSFIQPLAFEGDWMLVKVTQPTDGCTLLPGAITQEGWMRWRSNSQSSLIWSPPGGC